MPIDILCTKVKIQLEIRFSKKEPYFSFLQTLVEGIQVAF